MKKNAIVLLSGGLDSITCAAIAQNQNFNIYAISFDYGQRHSYELKCAQNIALKMKFQQHKIVNINLKTFGNSALTDKNIPVPKNKNINDIGKEIPLTYVPARNTIFLSYCLAFAEIIPAFDIFIGVNALDYSGYPDCRPEYIQAFENMANLATKIGTTEQKIKIQTPLAKLDKSEIIRLGINLGVDYSLTSTCYDVNELGQSCGSCEACNLRLRGFKIAGLDDPITYVNM